MNATASLAPGVSFGYDGSLCTVIEVTASGVIVRDSAARIRRLSYVDILTPMDEGGKSTLRGIRDDDAGATPLSVLWNDATEAAKTTAQVRADHVREVMTGFKSGTPTIARAGEPRGPYAPSVPFADRVSAKAGELGCGIRTLERWIAQYRQSGEIGLLDKRRAQVAATLSGLDGRWLKTARAVLDEQAGQPKVQKKIILGRIRARVERDFGPCVVAIPGQTTAYEALDELARGRNIFTGSTKSKRSIASGPNTPYGHLRATRPGEYVLLDTTPLNVFALNPVTGSWTSVDLTVAIDLYTRCVLGLRMTPASTKSIDVSAVLFEAFQPMDAVRDAPAQAAWPYHGVAEGVVVNTKSVHLRRFSPQPVVPETAVMDHGKAFLSEHVVGACARLGISVQPAHLFMGSDKAVVERLFGTIETLLQQLPGYKGRDISSRGDRPEEDFVYTIPQLEQIVREWIACVYHLTPHKGLFDPRLPGVALTPAQRFEQGIAVAGQLRVPTDRNVLLELLPVVTRQFNHYGVEINKLRYTGEIVTKYANRSRTNTRSDGRKWPFSIDPGDVSRIFFHDPDDNQWHTLRWDYESLVDVPFTLDALEFAKRRAIEQGEPTQVEAVLAQLLEDWGAGQALTPLERRTSARMVAKARTKDTASGIDSLATVQRLLDAARTPEPALIEELFGGIVDPDGPELSIRGGDDDADDNLADPILDNAYEPMELM
ncbi:helix-turn-helix domain-containing protein [Humibacter sp.]|uniref:helix-turn-helix domain-containing protein n=1 Tax=Humibacter sp. TaxID=1940291 RepID=UPI003F815606